ncbi:hypothetical protein, conserved [Trypanosoma brucei gambiense DAL972]|uniref:Uncharacterized protein n=1 Tax=Trypanosoma brucei gambiense (strain MHOM/CI/86/DAL972) TaxID=679716 RepID=C9ZK91_TRYB9|nr:hypothetical protein, conserved [Trypanosoma brucei gambiense DAL972]CBH09855.1 hypothetical protein, conserved [Trypanosoma brucei gambiense DAL972]|eukprot:XP_011772148.1 hypothetical protein, conserved [Trypanosoma brucei gambiense DAL972]
MLNQLHFYAPHFFLFLLDCSQALMDTLAFRVVRPMNGLTEFALLKHFGRHYEHFTPFNSKLIQRYALLNYVDHRTMLELLTQKARRPLAPQSFGGLRQTLQAVQRFPLELNNEKKKFETVFLASVLETPMHSLSSAEYGALWSLATQVTEWKDVLALSDTFPMQSTLQHQSRSEFRALLDQMFTTLPSTISPSNTPAVGETTSEKEWEREMSRPFRLLTELIGGECAVGRILDDIAQSVASWSDREAAVPTFVGVVHTLNRWPDGQIPDEKAWDQLILRVSTLQTSDLNQLLRLLTRVHSPIVPSYVRDSLNDALCADLWRCYLEQPNEPVAAFFESDELRMKRSPEYSAVVENDGSDYSNNGGDHVDESVAPVAEPPLQQWEMLRRLHVCTLEKQLTKEGPELALPTLINLFISSAFLEVHSELLTAILSALKASLPSSSSGQSRYMTPLLASSLAVGLYRVEKIMEQPGSDSSVASRVRKDVGAIERIILPLLQYESLRDYGCARCVMRLLCDCNHWCEERGLKEGCLKVLHDHAMDGFTKAHLEKLLGQSSSGLLELPEDVRDVISHCIADLPSR